MQSQLSAEVQYSGRTYFTLQPVSLSEASGSIRSPFLQFPLPRLLTTTRVILVRHGQSTFNQQGRFQGSSDAAVLTPHGQEMARQAGALLHAWPIDAVYCSPLRRVTETVAAMQTHMNGLPPIVVDPLLQEIHLPGWEGLPFRQVREQFRDEYDCWQQRPHEFCLPLPTAQKGNYFPVQELYERAQQFWHKLLKQHPGQTVLVVSHGGTNHALISTALGLAVKQHHRLQQSNGGVSVLDFLAGRPDAAQLRALNITSYLGETLPKLKAGKQGLRLLLVAANAEAGAVQSLAEHLQTIPIDFSLTSLGVANQTMTAQLLRYHPTTVQLQVMRQDFPQAWQQAIGSRSLAADTLITGLVVATDQEIKQILGRAIGLEPGASGYLQLYPGTLSVLHYPALNHPPVLQALNFA
ncbi:MAG: histidine phosphatase family protein [Synechococcales cyanobacterium M58_A2018_015]|nr:histidine phosphatase family protein [Synechococcales cyanobacterium M58_A2018_015]